MDCFRQPQNVLTPIEIAVDEISRRIAASDLIEVREVVGRRAYGRSDVPRNQDDRQNALPCEQLDECDRSRETEWNKKRQDVADSDVEMARQRDDEHRGRCRNRREENAIARDEQTC